MIRKIKQKIKSKFFKDSLTIALNDGLIVGEGCEIDPSVFFGSEPYLIKIGNKVRLTKNVQFVTHDGGMWVLRNLKVAPMAGKFGEIVIKDNVNVGWNSVIMPGVTINENVVVGLGSIVTKDVPPNSVVAGVPAKFICTIDEYYEKNKEKIDNATNFSIEEKKKYLLNKFEQNER